MSSRFAAWLCLIGAAACSHNNPEPAATADEVNQPNTASSDPAMTPASLETRSENTGPTSSSPATTMDSTAPSTASNTASTAPTSDGANSARTAGGTTTKGTSASSPGSSTNGAAVPPDNTKVNERDTNSATPTPPDQKENESDLKITQHVRQAVMADDSLSFTAKNVKIITQNGKVTLRGPVKTAQERDAIAAAARKVAGVTQVDNQIEVKK